MGAEGISTQDLQGFCTIFCQRLSLLRCSSVFSCPVSCLDDRVTFSNPYHLSCNGNLRVLIHFSKDGDVIEGNVGAEFFLGDSICMRTPTRTVRTRTVTTKFPISMVKNSASRTDDQK